MRGIVTGGAGFLGSHVADVLAEHGHDITVVDIRPSNRHRTERADLEDATALVGAFKGAEFVCHLAAVGDVYLAAEQPALAARLNVTGTANVADACLAAGVARLVYASTWEVYGEAQYQPIDEAHPCAPDHPYNITKLGGERLALSYARLRKDLSVSALRLGTAFGTRMRLNSVFSIFINRALGGEPIVIQGSGHQGRQFTHARDIGAAFALAIESGGSGRVYNVVADELVTIRQLAEAVSGAIPVEITTGPARPGDVPSSRVSNARAASELGWHPQISLQDGLAEMIALARKDARTGIKATS